MKRDNSNFKLVGGLLAGMIIGGATVVGANQAIQAIQNTEIKVSLNGKIQEFKDETTGEKQYPITYNNRTYLPLRNVAGLSGLDVDYDASTNTAILNSDENDSYLSFDKTTYTSYEELIDDFIKTANYDEKDNNLLPPISKFVGDYAIDDPNIANKIYYVKMDLNNDGIDELLLYSNEVKFLSVYGLQDGEVYNWLSPMTRSSFTLREGNIIEYNGSGGASTWERRLFKYVKNNVISFLEWKHDETSESFDIDSDRIMSNQYEALIERYPEKNIENGIKVMSSKI